MKSPSFTQKKFSKTIRVTTTSISALVNEKSLPSFEVAYAIGKELNKPIEEIWVKFEGRGEGNEDSEHES
ncbi:helix-turn-helix transcriptional regulator [Sutcliffiella rhizosphaerae]|uniref:HTH cro/C1-type domain-containing protein n=1 Tax=Sutcliffiella rhizosphaerae TaxID=2880967 RepID=A0ABN8AEQ8_9BACI|nr:helix-turn-helix domain-containing protein [Sutcliffiella rhizosphaerae]CAG9623776.1 hypothetical protein BACCIP111883_04610 [Sutcliffiella rhizosphaerae]